MNPLLTYEGALQLLRSGSPAERIQLTELLPESPFKSDAQALVVADNPAMVVVGLSALVQPCCYGAQPEIGAALAAALHDRACEIVERRLGEGLDAGTLSSLAAAHLNALSLLGNNDDLLRQAPRYLALYRDEPQNRGALETLRLQALVALERFDEAEKVLEGRKELEAHPIHGVEFQRLRER